MPNIRRLVAAARESVAVFLANREILRRSLTPFEYSTICKIHNLPKEK